MSSYDRLLLARYDGDFTMFAGRETTYEANQNFNALTTFLHSTRYRVLTEKMSELSKEITDRPIKVIDIGCGPGTAVGTLVDGFNVDYVGIDYDETFIDAARKKYGDRENCRFLLADAGERSLYKEDSADIVIALESFEHIPANRVVDIVEHVCTIVKPRIFLVTVPVEVGPALWIKNWGSSLMGYDRQSGNVRETFWAGLYRLDKVPPHTVSHLGFDWRWLAHTMRVNSPLTETRSMPFSFLPKWCAPNVALVSSPKKGRAHASVPALGTAYADFLGYFGILAVGGC